ncbi:hypothetical protein D3C75_566520 [compost metagenome]
MGQAFKDARNRFADQVDHAKANHQTGEQRNDQDRFQRFHTLRQLKLRADELRHITRKEASNDTADKARTGAYRQHPADKTWRQAWTIRDRKRNVTCQHWHHQRKRRAATNLHQCRCQRALLFKGFDTKGERERNTETTGYHHRQHVRDARQQVTIGTRRLFLAFAGRGCRVARRLIQLRFCLRFIQLLRRFLQRQAGRGAVHRLTGKLRQVHFNIRRDDHQIGCSHLFRGDSIAGTHRAAGFDFNPPAAFFGFGFNGFSRHKGMRYTGWASGDRDHAFWTTDNCRGSGCNRCAVHRRMAFRFAQEQFRVCHGAIDIAQPHFFAVQRAVSRDVVSQHDDQFGIARVVDEIKVCFMSCRTQQRFRHIGASLSEGRVNNQQRFHYASPAVS